MMDLHTLRYLSSVLLFGCYSPSDLINAASRWWGRLIKGFFPISFSCWCSAFPSGLKCCRSLHHLWHCLWPQLLCDIKPKSDQQTRAASTWDHDDCYFPFKETYGLHIVSDTSFTHTLSGILVFFFISMLLSVKFNKQGIKVMQAPGKRFCSGFISLSA